MCSTLMGLYNHENSLTKAEDVSLLFCRCPSGIQTSKEASPRVVTSKILGGVDQASLRLSLTSQAKMKASGLHYL